MESTEENEHDVLKKVLTSEELAQIPQEIGKKLTTYFTEHFEEYLTAKAVFQHGRQSLGNNGKLIQLLFFSFVHAHFHFPP